MNYFIIARVSDRKEMERTNIFEEDKERQKVLFPHGDTTNTTSPVRYECPYVMLDSYGWTTHLGFELICVLNGYRMVVWALE